MSHSLERLRGAHVGIALFACLMATPGAQAQPTGNPKGTAAPPEASAPKAGVATRPTPLDGSNTDTGKLVGDSAQTRARMQASRPPGHGTEGGLSSKGPSPATRDAGKQPDKGSASPRPALPSR